MGLWVWPKNKDSIITVEKSRFATTEKSATKSVDVKTMLVVFFDSTGIVYHEYAPRGQTVNQE